MAMDLDRKRWLVLLACVAANLVQGTAYASSVFAGPMMEHLKCSKEQWAIAFSLSIGLLPVGMLVSGLAADRRTPRLGVALGGVLFGSSMFLAGFSNSLAWLYVTFGALLSLGSGAVYGAAIAAAVRWFPERRGFASGLAVGALGFGTAIIAPVAQRLIQMPQLGVLGMFKVLGGAFVVILLAASAVITNPPKDYAPAGFSPASPGASENEDGLVWSEMLARPRFWLLYVLYVLGAFGGLMIISQAAPIAQELAKMSTAAAAGMVAALGLANATGRVAWGFVSDRLGRLTSLSVMFLVTAVLMFAMPNLASKKSTLIPAVVLIGICFGGYLGTFPSLSADAFGTRNAAVNYALMFSAFSLSGLIGPRVGAILGQGPGGYPQAFMVAGVIATAGLVLVVSMRIADVRRPTG
jgi:OFA family oxalate/formate antiporter-like MFS transporter